MQRRREVCSVSTKHINFSLQESAALNAVADKSQQSYNGVV